MRITLAIDCQTGSLLYRRYQSVTPAVTIFRGRQAVLSKAINMRSDEGRNPVRSEAGTDRRRYALWYVQHEGSRSYVRMTGLGLLAAAIFTLIPALLILTLFFRKQAQQQRDLENVNINITVPPLAPGNYGGTIARPTPMTMPTPPKADRSQRVREPTRQMPAAPSLNANAPPNPSPTATPTLQRSPG